MAVREKENRAGRRKPELASLLQQILEQVQDLETLPPPSGNGNNSEVLLQVRIEDSQYVLTRKSIRLPSPTIRLSPWEEEIVRLVAKGLPNKTIAAVLGISPWTVATHLRRVFGKLQVSSRAEMVARALRQGLLGGNR